MSDGTVREIAGAAAIVFVAVPVVLIVVIFGMLAYLEATHQTPGTSAVAGAPKKRAWNSAHHLAGGRT
jgi:hypothetical protein